MGGLGLAFLPQKLGSGVQQQKVGAELDKREPLPVDDLTRRRAGDGIARVSVPVH